MEKKTMIVSEKEGTEEEREEKDKADKVSTLNRIYNELGWTEAIWLPINSNKQTQCTSHFNGHFKYFNLLQKNQKKAECNFFHSLF